MAAETAPAGRPPPEFQAALEDFLEVLRVEAAVSRHTLGAYRADVERFGLWCRDQGLERPDQVHAERVVDYLDDCRREGLAEASTARRLSAIRMFLRHLYAEGRLDSDPLARLSAPVLRRPLPARCPSRRWIACWPPPRATAPWPSATAPSSRCSTPAARG